MSLPDAKGYSAHSTVLPVVPMFHVNAWGIPYAAALCGSKLVLPGAGMDGASLYELFETEEVESSAGVPTVWLNLIKHLQDHRLKFSHAQVRDDRRRRRAAGDGPHAHGRLRVRRCCTAGE